jgi:hypothetical protein
MRATEIQPNLIDLRGAIRSPSGRVLFRLLESTVNRVLSLSEVNRLYAQLPILETHDNYFPTILRALAVGYELTEMDLAKIPRHGPVIVVANHPFGAVDGLILGDIMTSLAQAGRPARHRRATDRHGRARGAAVSDEAGAGAAARQGCCN